MKFADLLAKPVEISPPYKGRASRAKPRDPDAPQPAITPKSKYYTPTHYTHQGVHDLFKSILEPAPLPTHEIAQRLLRDRGSVYSSLKRFESYGLVRRIGFLPIPGTKPAIIWQWITESERKVP